jgi:hypothetical protein
MAVLFQWELPADGLSALEFEFPDDAPIVAIPLAETGCPFGGDCVDYNSIGSLEEELAGGYWFGLGVEGIYDAFNFNVTVVFATFTPTPTPTPTPTATP